MASHGAAILFEHLLAGIIVIGLLYLWYLRLRYQDWRQRRKRHRWHRRTHSH